MAPATERLFSAMGGRAQVLVVGRPDLAALAEARISELEGRWSRFLAASDVSRANRSAGLAVEVHADTIELARMALRAQDETGGAFDPLLGANLAALGYDRPFADIDPDQPLGTAPHRRPAFLDLDRRAGTLTIPVGCGFDAGGIGKGLAADLTVDALEWEGARGVLVNLGGDIRVWGQPPTPDGWVVSVEHPLEPGSELVRVVLADGAVASSSRLHRAWGPDEARAHHLLDPATGLPVANGVAAVTVFAATGWRAEAFTKAVFLAGPEDGLALLETQGLDGMVVTDDGVCQATPHLTAVSL